MLSYYLELISSSLDRLSYVLLCEFTFTADPFLFSSTDHPPGHSCVVSQANGQNCIGIERFIVHRSNSQQFIDQMLPRVKSLQCGSSLSSLDESSVTKNKVIPPVDCGAMVSDRGFDGLERLLKDAEKAGAKVLTGGKRFTHETWTKGTYFEPTMIVDVKSDMEIAQHERKSTSKTLVVSLERIVRLIPTPPSSVFAPVMTVLPYDTIEEAIEIANSTRYGLGSAVFGPSKSLCRRVAKEMRTGMVAINDFGVFYLAQSMPFGGVKASGHGRFGKWW